MDSGNWLGIVLLLSAFGIPALLGLSGLVLRGPVTSPPLTSFDRWNWRLLLHSCLLYALAFNLTFFIQELFLVVPKALTPGLRPTLYHNNHGWEGSHPLETLFQGTGAAAIFLSGLLFAWLSSRSQAGAGTRLFLVWMAFHGLLQSLPQLATAPLSPGSDSGMALDYFRMSDASEAALALAAMVAIACTGLWLTRPFLEFADSAEQISTAGARTRFIANIVTVPAFLAIPVILLFRVPREAIEVIAPPVAVALVGTVWLQAGAWRVCAEPKGNSQPRPLLVPGLALLALLAFFQLVLRHGIDFY